MIKKFGEKTKMNQQYDKRRFGRKQESYWKNVPLVPYFVCNYNTPWLYYRIIVFKRSSKYKFPSFNWYQVEKYHLTWFRMNAKYNKFARFKMSVPNKNSVWIPNTTGSGSIPFHSQNFKSGYQAVFSFSFCRSLQSSVCSISSSKHTCHYIDIKTSCKSVKPYIYENRNIHSSFLLFNIINSLLLVTKSWTVAGAELLGLKKVVLSFRWLEADIGIVNRKALTFQVYRQWS